MNIVCISASNVEPARSHSASTRTCELIAEHITGILPETNVEVVPLIDYDLAPCHMCGGCLPEGHCARDEAFNRLFAKLEAAEAVFVVCPHYAPIPSKLMILFEKLEEIFYLQYCQDPDYHFPLSGKPTGVIAHGGQATPEALPYYKSALLDPIAGALSSVQMRVIGLPEGQPGQWANGVTFGIRSLEKPAGSPFVTIEHDWDAIREAIAPLVDSVVIASMST